MFQLLSYTSQKIYTQKIYISKDSDWVRNSSLFLLKGKDPNEVASDQQNHDPEHNIWTFSYRTSNGGKLKHIQSSWLDQPIQVSKARADLIEHH